MITPTPLPSHLINQVWPLIEEVATIELGFPPSALVIFRTHLSEKKIQELATNKQTPLLAVEMNKRLVGVLIGAKNEGNVGTVIWLIVSPTFRGQGIGKALFNAACKIYYEGGAHKIKLTTPTKQAVIFYKKQKMSVEGFHPNHWWHLDFWSLAKSLK